MFRDPEDGKILTFGWPWHGLITNNKVALPSGREIALELVSHQTWLWDVGMPDPAYVPADPDEKWLGKAIIRGVLERGFYDGSTNWPRIAPARVGGTNLAFNYVQVSSREPTYKVAYVDIAAGVDLYRSPDISWSDIGMPSAPLGQLQGRVLDVGNDGARFLIMLVDTAFGDSLAIIESRLVESGGVISNQIEIIADYTQVCRYTVVESTTYNIPPVRRIGWDLGVETNLQENPFLQNALPTGEYSAHALSKCVVGAWYDQAGAVQLVWRWVDAYHEYSCIDPTPVVQAWTEAARGEVWHEAAGVTTDPVGFGASVLSENLTSTTSRTTISQVVAADEIFHLVENWSSTRASPPIPMGDIPSWTATATSNPSRLQTELSTGVTVYDDVTLRMYIIPSHFASNRVAQTTIVAEVTAAPTRFYAGPALTPHGADPGLVVGAAAEPYIAQAAYNPITGQLIRNQAGDSRHSWI